MLLLCLFIILNVFFRAPTNCCSYVVIDKKQNRDDDKTLISRTPDFGKFRGNLNSWILENPQNPQNFLPTKISSFKVVEGQVIFYFDIKRYSSNTEDFSKYTKNLLRCWLVVNEFINNFDQRTAYINGQFD